MNDRPPPHHAPLPQHPPCRVRLPGQATISTEIRNGGEVVAERTETVQFDSGYEAIRNPAYVGVKGGVTQSPRQFEFIRIDVEVRLPCHAHDEALDAAYQRASRKVNEYLNAELDNALGNTADTSAQSPLHG